jgi:hypothetical protein
MLSAMQPWLVSPLGFALISLTVAGAAGYALLKWRHWRRVAEARSQLAVAHERDAQAGNDEHRLQKELRVVELEQRLKKLGA